VADIVILTEYTEKVAIGEKDCSGTATTNQGALLPKMRGIARDNSLGTCFTNSFFTRQPVNLAFTWTNHAWRQPLLHCGDTFVQFPFPV
jgi:hypothetical protein